VRAPYFVRLASASRDGRHRLTDQRRAIQSRVSPNPLKPQEHPVLVPQVMHPTCRFQDVSGVQIRALLLDLASAGPRHV